MLFFKNEIKNPVVTPLESWPQPHSISEVLIFASEGELAIRYLVAGGEQAALVHFPCISALKFGAPSNELLMGHPLSKYGLTGYGVHRVNNSIWISELEGRNSIRPAHDKDRYMGKKAHYVFTFQDSTLECIANRADYCTPVYRTLSSATETRVEWAKLVAQISLHKEDF